MSAITITRAPSHDMDDPMLDANIPHFLKSRIGGVWITMGLWSCARDAMERAPKNKQWFKTTNGFVSSCGNYWVKT